LGPIANFSSLLMEVVGDLSLNVVEHDAHKFLLISHTPSMVEKVELDHSIMRTLNLQDFVKPYY
jgi:hypothetical protein